MNRNLVARAFLAMSRIKTVAPFEAQNSLSLPLPPHKMSQNVYDFTFGSSGAPMCRMTDAAAAIAAHHNSQREECSRSHVSRAAAARLEREQRHIRVVAAAAVPAPARMHWRTAICLFLGSSSSRSRSRALAQHLRDELLANAQV